MTTTTPLDVTEASNEQLKEAYVFLTANPGKHPGVLDAVNAEIAERVQQQLDALTTWQDEKASKAPKVVAQVEADEEAAPATIKDRPKTIDDVVGQTDVVNQIRTVVIGSKIGGDKVPHILLVGPPGHGKTTLAEVVAHDIGVPMVQVTGINIHSEAEMTAILIQITEPTALFVDEVHSLPKPAMEALYTAMEDGVVHGKNGSGQNASALTHKVPGLVLIGATTRPGLLTPPMRDRFGYTGTMVPYTVEQLAVIVERGWKRVGLTFDDGENVEVAKRSKGIPRLALNQAQLVKNVAATKGSPQHVAAGMAADGLAIFGISESGLDETDFRILTLLTTKYVGKAVGLDTLAQELDLDKQTLADQYEPYLVRQGYMARTARGRMAQEPAYALVKALGEAA